MIVDRKTELSRILRGHANKYMGLSTWGKELEDMLLSRLGTGVEFIVAYILGRTVQFRKKLVMPLINRWLFIDWITMKNVEPYSLMYFQIGYWNREEFKGIHYLEMYMEKCGTVSEKQVCH